MQVDLDNGLITVTGLTGALTCSDPEAVYMTTTVDDQPISGVFCIQGGSGQTLQDTGVWDEAANVLVLQSCSNFKLESQRRYNISFDVRNPYIGQTSPSITIDADGSADIELVVMDKDSSDLLGVNFGSNPLLVQIIESDVERFKIESSASFCGDGWMDLSREEECKRFPSYLESVLLWNLGACSVLTLFVVKLDHTELAILQVTMETQPTEMAAQTIANVSRILAVSL